MNGPYIFLLPEEANDDADDDGHDDDGADDGDEDRVRRDRRVDGDSGPRSRQAPVVVPLCCCLWHHWQPYPTGQRHRRTDPRRRTSFFLTFSQGETERLRRTAWNLKGGP